VGRHPGVPPSGFIFHVSRCGSTLVTRMLSLLDRVIVLPEPTILGQVCSLDEALLPAADRPLVLQQVVSALGQRRSGNENALVIKLPSSDILHLKLFRSAFPEAPWVFLHRDPVEVLVSVLENPTGWLRAKRAGRPLLLPGLSGDDLRAMSDEEYCARTLAAFYRCALDEFGPAARVVDYRRLPSAVVNEIAELFVLECNEEERQRMLGTVHIYSKDRAGQRVFVSDAERKQSAASTDLRRLVQAWVSGLSAELSLASR
jgi:hypothetical protein